MFGEVYLAEHLGCAMNKVLMRMHQAIYAMHRF